MKARGRSLKRPEAAVARGEQLAAVGEFLRECEGVLGVEGPCGLARRTLRSKAWWSKVRSLHLRFSDWEYLERHVLPPDLPEDARERLHRCHLETWRRLHDPEGPDEPSSLEAGVEATEEQVQSLEGLAVRALIGGQCADALRALELLETVLRVHSPTRAWRTQQRLLARCYRLQSACQRRLGQPGEAMALAHCAVECGQLAGSAEEVAAAQAELARAEAALAR